MASRIPIERLTAGTTVRFGTSGVRGLVSELSDRVCYGYTVAFLQHLEALGELRSEATVALGGDLRPSTGRMLGAVARAILDRGYRPLCCGRVPSPALALYGMQQGCPTVMVTGSHIPDDRNGIKFTRSAGEILKLDEQSISRQKVSLPDCFDEAGQLRPDHPAPDVPTSDGAARSYVQRWLDGLPKDLLGGARLGLYEHSAVGRDLLHEILTGLGAEVIRLGRSDTFVPVDTEAIRPEDAELARGWAEEHRLDAILSTDGDSDRPLLSDEHGRWLRGDVAGILCARFVAARVVVTPVSCNTAVDRCGWFAEVRRTRIGSPYVIAEMNQAVEEGAHPVVGYEANGGFLIGTDIDRPNVRLTALPTRDPVIVQLGILALAFSRNLTMSELLQEVPQRFTSSDRLKEFPSERSSAKLAELAAGGHSALEAVWGPLFGTVSSVDLTDGLRVIFTSEEILHVRPSGNAPELRCYAEADTEARAHEMTTQAIAVMDTWR